MKEAASRDRRGFNGKTTNQIVLGKTIVISVSD